MIHNRMNDEAYSISALSQALKVTIETQFDHVRVRGEISSLKIAASGHAYFSLKDENAVLSAICWRSKMQQLPIKIEDGLEVIVTGSITTYPARSNYQIIVSSIELSGEGALLKLLQDRKEKLLKEGYFDHEHKQKIPFLPKKIGVITSPTGSVIQDIIHRIKERFPLEILIWPVMVQGDQAAKQTIDAIKGFNNASFQKENGIVDIIIIARGGGSLEDLWAFNDEEMVIAAYHSSIPIISAIGHETDYSLLDLVADKRAPTPTAAAEFAVPEKNILIQNIDDKAIRLKHACDGYIRQKKQYFNQTSKHIPPLEHVIRSKKEKLDHASQRFFLAMTAFQKRKQEELHNRRLPHHYLARLQHDKISMMRNIDQQLHNHVKHFMQLRQQKLQQYTTLLHAVSYKKTLKRGFAIVKDEDSKIITSHQQIKPHTPYHIMLADEHKTTVILAPKKMQKDQGPLKQKTQKNESNKQTSLWDDHE